MQYSASFVGAAMLTALVLGAGQASAATLVENEELELDLIGLGEVGLVHHESHEAHASANANQVNVNLARLAGKARWVDLGGLIGQVEARSGEAQLLDAAVYLQPVDVFRLKAGRFKVPVSAEYLVPASAMLFSKRAAFVSLAPGRLNGAEVTLSPHLGDTAVELRTALFIPETPEGDVAPGALAVGRLAVEGPAHTWLHLGFAEHVFAANEANREPGTETPRPFEHERQLDAAIMFHTEPWKLHLEALYVFDGPEETQPYGAVASAAYDFHVGERILEPAVAYDFLDRGEEVLHRGTAALNTYWHSTDLMTTVEYEFETESGHGEESGGPQHTFSVLLQAGF